MTLNRVVEPKVPRADIVDPVVKTRPTATIITRNKANDNACVQTPKTNRPNTVHSVMKTRSMDRKPSKSLETCETFDFCDDCCSNVNQLLISRRRTDRFTLPDHGYTSFTWTCSLCNKPAVCNDLKTIKELRAVIRDILLSHLE